jgi:hypothetical protein
MTNKKKQLTPQDDVVFYKKHDISNPFLQGVSEGSSIKTLTRAASFFKRYKNTLILPYYFALSGGVRRPIESFSSADGLKCAICGLDIFNKEYDTQTVSFANNDDIKESKRQYFENFKKSFNIDSSTIEELVDSDLVEVTLNKVVLSPKEHSVFVDCQGHALHTCFKVSSCIKRATGSIDQRVVDFTDVSIDDFLTIKSVEPGKSESARIRNLRAKFNEVVKPFIKKWQYTSVNKLNFMELVSDMERLEDFLVFIDKGSAHKTALERILNAVGVKF